MLKFKGWPHFFNGLNGRIRWRVQQWAPFYFSHWRIIKFEGPNGNLMFWCKHHKTLPVFSIPLVLNGCINLDVPKQLQIPACNYNHFSSLAHPPRLFISAWTEVTLLSLILQYTACICTASHYDCEGELGCSSGDGTIYHTGDRASAFPHCVWFYAETECHNLWTLYYIHGMCGLLKLWSFSCFLHLCIFFLQSILTFPYILAAFSSVFVQLPANFSF